MGLAKAFYQLKLDEVSAISHRLALDPWVIQNLDRASSGSFGSDPHYRSADHQQDHGARVRGNPFNRDSESPRGTWWSAGFSTRKGIILPLISKGEWGQLPIVKEALERGKPQAATEVIPVEYLSQVGLDRQAFVPLVETPLAAPEPFDPREGKAGLALTGVHPLHDPGSKDPGCGPLGLSFQQ